MDLGLGIIALQDLGFGFRVTYPTLRNYGIGLGLGFGVQGLGNNTILRLLIGISVCNITPKPYPILAA